MRIWFLNQFYPPDLAPTGAMLQVVAARLVVNGHGCVVWCSGGSYGGSAPEASRASGSDGVRVMRVGKLGAGRSFLAKLSGWLGFYLVLTLRLLMARERPDVIVALTTPPFLSVLARVAAWRHGARHAHWVMDLYPDVLAAHGMLRKEQMIYQILAGLSRWGMGGQRCGAVLTLGPCMAERCGRVISDQSSVIREEANTRRRVRVDALTDSSTQNSKSKIQHRSVSWVPLWASAAGEISEGAGERLRLERGWCADEVVILYSGNLGRGHVVEPALEAALQLSRAGHQRLRWVFCAHGARLEEVRRFAAANPELTIEFLKPVPTGQLPAHLASADLHLASLEASWAGCMVPSKIQGSFAAGRAVLFIGPRLSSPARWIEESGGGWAVEAHDAEAKLVEILAAEDLKAEARRRGLAAKEHATRHFDRDVNAAEVARILMLHRGSHHGSSMIE